MPGYPQSDDPLLSEQPRPAIAGTESTEVTGDLGGRSVLEEPELEAALQLLVERAQYITGATGTALALPQGNEMVCRASAGSCAPAVGARLQVRSGLTGESIARRQLLRCDNAETDPRVNLETCQALGIASIVVLPLLRRNGEVRGLFELFSDHPYAFEERDLIALERMADLTLTALDLAEQRYGTVPPPPPVKPPEQSAELAAPPTASNAQPAMAIVTSAEPAPAAPVPAEPAPAETAPLEFAAADRIPPQSADSGAAPVPDEPSAPQPPQLSSPEPAPILESEPLASVPEAMRRIQKCAACGFPVSEGRSLCLDCERKESFKKQSEKKQRQNQAQAKLEGTSPAEANPAGTNPAEPGSTQAESSLQPPTTVSRDEILPPFLANSVPVEASWLANHVNLLAILVLIVGIVLAVVVFR